MLLISVTNSMAYLQDIVSIITRIERGLYLVEDVLEEALVVVVSLHHWHQIFGHPLNEKLKFLSSSLFSNKELSKHFCSRCPLTKQKILSFQSLNHVANDHFDLIYCDIWRPYHIQDHKGHKYFLLLWMIVHISHGFS